MSKGRFRNLVVFVALLSFLIWGQLPVGSASQQQARLGSTMGVIGFVGYVVDDVAVDSPAAKADIRKNDIIVYLNGRLVHSADTITETMALTPPGTSIEVKFLRYEPDVKKYGPHVVALVTKERNPPGQTKWIYRQSQ